jgi:hypothetical protein
MTESFLRRGWNWLVGTLHSPWLETVAEVRSKNRETTDAREQVLDAFVPVTNPATKTFIPLPISTSAKKRISYFLHLDFLGMEAKLPTRRTMFESVEAGDRLRIKYQLGRGGKVKRTWITEIIKGS